MRYIQSAENITSSQLHGFFVGWPNPPSLNTHLNLLKSSDYIVLAIDEEQNRVVGFITAISDGVLSAYIPLLEVLPEYQGRGIGKQLVEKMVASLRHLYMIDVLCDEELQPFYEKFTMVRAKGMIIRNYDRQSGSY